jgi:ABC-2 type transport system permease protein
LNRTEAIHQRHSKTPFTRSSSALAQRWFRRLRREPIDLALSLAQPVIWLLLFGSLFTNVVAVSYSYIAFMTAGVIVMTIFNGALGGGVELLFDRESGMLRRLIAAPISPSSIIASRMIFVLLIAAGQSLLVLLVGAVVGVGIVSGALGIVLILLTSLLLGIGILSASMALAYALRGHATFFQITGFISLPIIFASSALAPLSEMPSWLQGVARLNPLTYAIDGVRNLILQGIDWIMLGSVLLVLTLFDVAMFAIANWVFSRAVES